MSTLSAHASAFARTALANIVLPYPNHPGHVLCNASDLMEPSALHPVFYGSFDWHSSVHMHWLLLKLLHSFPDLPEKDRILGTLQDHFTAIKIEKELCYFQHPVHRTFERTYGWAWLLKLQTALTEVAPSHPRIEGWHDCVRLLADVIAQRYLDFLPIARFPIRAGVHGNSAFGLLFALEYARSCGHTDLADAVTAKALEWFGQDQAYPAHYEPGGDDFLSGGLVEAVLMQQVLGSTGFACWWKDFCPPAAAMQIWLTPVAVADRSDLKLAHLDGLNLSRAWCWRNLRPALPAPLAATVDLAVDAHLAASLPYAVQGDYAGTHWLASFALLALLPTTHSG